MKLDKPKVSRVHVEAKDPDTKRRVCFTVYDCTPEQIKQRIHEVADKPRKREPATA